MVALDLVVQLTIGLLEMDVFETDATANVTQSIKKAKCQALTLW